MIDKLEMFIALAREGHFGRAAESLGLTQPTLSAGIKALEAQLGVQLVWRGSRYGGLTPEGQRVLVWARQIVADTRTMREEMRAVRQGLAGNLRLAVIPTALTTVADLTGQFGRAHPNVRFTILSRTSAEILAMIENLEVDAGISYLDNEPLGRVTTVPLYRESYMFVCGADSPLAGRSEVGWDEIADEPLCLLTPDMQNRRIINQHFQEAGRSVTGAVESNSTVVLMSHVVTGRWVTILPVQMAEFLAAGKEVRIVPLKSGKTRHAVGLIAPYREPHTPVLAALLREAQRISQI
ncbi:LysR family transcriptional regulator [Defluviimonas sp. WL0050]|uniref:LysR family transcriptional regulator n=1 Tax=Albidovulum litorale TaxID=2984134 RepID=A0ABT2ZNG3_9RHOB|nr:LysR family transcriptional regulator [Defluviimonas sp. WL0050]MCV2872674.1 LysR family transcriptional regulator [Defluviimonas sp. WL0050]